MTSKTRLYPSWSPLQQKKQVSAGLLATESERWAALLRDSNAYVLSMDPLKYGPLSVEGFITAKKADENMYTFDDRWPADPVNLAKLLIACGATEQIASASVRLLHSMPATWGLAETLYTHLSLLTQLGVEPTAKHLTDLMSSFKLKTTRFSVDSAWLIAGFDAMQSYLTQPGAATAFLTEWLPTVAAGAGNYGTESLGCALAEKFTDADPEVIAAWCTRYDDQQGLGYLVWQQRQSLADWLHAVASSVANDPAPRSNSHDSSVQPWLRKREQLDTLEALCDKLPRDVLREQAQTFLCNHPDQAHCLTDWCGEDYHQMRNIKWLCLLLDLKLASDNDPAVTDWLTKADAVQEEHSKTFGGYGSDHRSTQLEPGWYRQWGPRTAAYAPNMQAYLARRLVMDVNVRTSTAQFEELEHLSWLKDMPFKYALEKRKTREPGAADLFIQLVPFMRADELPEIGAWLAQSCGRNAINARSTRTIWKQHDPVRFGKPIPNSYSDAAYLLYALTRQDPHSMLTALRELGVSSYTDDYRDAMSSWLATTLGVEKTLPVLPTMSLSA